MAALEESIEVAVPVASAFEAWTRFEDYPKFMRGVVAVEMLDHGHMRWRTRVEGVEGVWEAELVELRPDERIAWRGLGDTVNAGVATFDRLDENHTRVTVSVALTLDLDGYAGRIADVERTLREQMHADLMSFKALVEP